MKAKAFLNQLRGMETRIRVIQSQQLDVLQDAAPVTTQIKTVSIDHNNAENTVDARNARYSDEISILKQEEQRLKAIQEDVRSVIYQIKNNNLASVLMLYYDKGYTWEQVADEIGYSRQRVDQFHSQAVQEVQSILTRREGLGEIR